MEERRRASEESEKMHEGLREIMRGREDEGTEMRGEEEVNRESTNREGDQGEGGGGRRKRRK